MEILTTSEAYDYIVSRLKLSAKSLTAKRAIIRYKLKLNIPWRSHTEVIGKNSKKWVVKTELDAFLNSYLENAPLVTSVKTDADYKKEEVA